MDRISPLYPPPCITIYFLIIILGSPGMASAQVKDSLHQQSLLRRSIVPTALITGGLLINHSQFEQNIQEKIRSGLKENFHSELDDYLQYAPIAELYLADILGVKSRNHWFDQTKYLLISNLLTSGITQGLKYITLKERPNGAPYAFPSGHTSFAFNNAAVLYKEFTETSPLLAYSGYAFATTTGLYRILNNKHWLSDVILGAGIGLLVVELVYYFEPFKGFNPFKKMSGSFTCIPTVCNSGFGLTFVQQF